MGEIRLSNSRSFQVNDFLPRLNDYNTYYDGKPEQLRTWHTKNGVLVIDGLLNVYWGLRTAIRLQVADEEAKIRPSNQNPSNLDGNENRNSLVIPGGTVDLDNAIWGRTKQRKPASRMSRLKPVGENKEIEDLSSQGLMRTNSVTVRKKPGRNIRHRASINGHIYNHKTSVFTPAFGSVTKVRVSSLNNANEVMIKLLNKFRVENSPDDFSFYIVKETEERRELPRDEYPLLSRILIGPNERLGKIFLMERKMHEEISPEVAQYIKLDNSILNVVLKKFQEEEEKEVKKLKKRFDLYRKMLKRRLNEG